MTQTWLDAWEQASALPVGLREAELLSRALEDADAAALSELPIGERDRLLFQLRVRWFGPALHCVASCPSCAEPCEWTCSVDALCAAKTEAVAREHTAEQGPLRVTFRVPNSRDLAALSELEDPELARACLLARCVLAAHLDDQLVALDALPSSTLDEVARAMTDADPAAMTSVALSCPACDAGWEADFDIAAFAWAELDAWAQRTLEDVHRLALQYGWTEAAILALTPARRARYLALVNA